MRFPIKNMARLRNTGRLAAVSRETNDERPMNGRSRNTSVHSVSEECITQFFDEIENRVTEKSSRGFGRPQSCILGGMSVCLK